MRISASCRDRSSPLCVKSSGHNSSTILPRGPHLLRKSHGLEGRGSGRSGCLTWACLLYCPELVPRSLLDIFFLSLLFFFLEGYKKKKTKNKKNKNSERN